MWHHMVSLWENVVYACSVVQLYPTLCDPMDCGSDSKDSAYNVGNPDAIPGLGKSPVEGNGNPLQYSCLENSMDRGV